MSALLVIGIVVVLGIAFIGWYNSEGQQTRRSLRGATRVSIRDAPEGVLIKLEGTARAYGKVLIAPLSKRRCVYWEVLVEERRQSGKTTTWVDVLRERRGRPFVLDDGEHRALVQADDRCDLALHADAHFSSGTFNDAPDHISAWLEKRGRATTGWFGFNKGMRYREAVIEPKEFVVVLGVGRREVDPDPSAVAGYREKARRLVVEAPPGGALLLSDDPSLQS